MSNQSGGKYASLQILRAIAAWTVVYHHYMQLYFELPAATPLGAAVSKYGDVGVDIFFVLSGFVMFFASANGKTGARAFMIGRIFRVAPLYWFYTLAIIVCILLMPAQFSYTGFSTKSLVASLLFLPHANTSGLGAYPILTPGWTLNFEMFFYASLAVSMALTKRFFGGVLCVVFLCLPLFYPSRAIYADVASSFLLYEFLAGFGLAVLLRGQPGSRLIASYPRVAILLAAAAAVSGVAALATYNVRFPFAVSVVLLALLVERHIDLRSSWIKLLVRLGNESYSTYLSHVLVIGTAIHFTGKNLSELAQLLTLLSITIGVWLLSRLSYRHIEQSKYLDALRRKWQSA